MGLNIPLTCSHGRCFLEGKGLGGLSVPWTCANGWCWDDFNIHWTCWHVPCYGRQGVAGVILTFLELARIVDAAEHTGGENFTGPRSFNVSISRAMESVSLRNVCDLASACLFNCKEPRGVSKIETKRKLKHVTKMKTSLESNSSSTCHMHQGYNVIGFANVVFATQKDIRNQNPAEGSIKTSTLNLLNKTRV